MGFIVMILIEAVEKVRIVILAHRQRNQNIERDCLDHFNRNDFCKESHLISLLISGWFLINTS